jgi:hypothetical protein
LSRRDKFFLILRIVLLLVLAGYFISVFFSRKLNQTLPLINSSIQGKSGTVYRVKLKRAKLNPDKIGPAWMEHGGQAQVRVWSGDRLVYSSPAKKADPPKHEFIFDDIFTFTRYPGETCKVELVDRDRWSDDLVLTKISSQPDNGLFIGLLEQDGSLVEFEKVVRSGVYLITLEKSYIANDDFLVAGGQSNSSNNYERRINLMLKAMKAENKIRDFSESLWDELKKEALKQTGDPMNQKIKILQNSKLVFDSASYPPQKYQAVDWHIRFKINWKPDDLIEIFLYDEDSWGNPDDLIFKASSNTRESIELLNGTVWGGISGNSFIIFTQKYRK